MQPVVMQSSLLCASIGDVVSDAWDALMGLLGDFISWLLTTTIVSWLTNSLLKPFVEHVLDLSDQFYNLLVNKAFGMLTQDPKSWSASGWNVISDINDTLISTIGLSLLVVFFAIGFCKNSLEPREDLRFENVLKMFLKLSVASWFMYNAIHIVAAMFGIVNLMVGGNSFVSERATMRDFFDAAYNKVTQNGSVCDGEIFGGMLVTAILSIAFAAASVGAGMMILYQAFTRFFKILVILPYGSIASTTLAGDQVLSQSAVSFYKYALNCILEAATMAVAMVVFAKLSDQLPLGLFQEPAASLQDVFGRIFTEMILLMTMYGVIKQSSVMTQRALGL